MTMTENVEIAEDSRNCFKQFSTSHKNIRFLELTAQIFHYFIVKTSKKKLGTDKRKPAVNVSEKSKNKTANLFLDYTLS